MRKFQEWNGELGCFSLSFRATFSEWALVPRISLKNEFALKAQKRQIVCVWIYVCAWVGVRVCVCVREKKERGHTQDHLCKLYDFVTIWWEIGMTKTHPQSQQRHQPWLQRRRLPLQMRHPQQHLRQQRWRWRCHWRWRWQNLIRKNLQLVKNIPIYFLAAAASETGNEC